MKRILCAILCFAMLLGLCPTTFAVDDINEFVIENGVLVKYTGNGGDVAVPKGVTEIGSQAFSQVRGKSYISSVIIPEGCVKIGDEAFYFAGDLVTSMKVTLPSTLREIGAHAFECAHVTQINFPQGLETIGDEAFSQAWMESVELPSSLRTLGEGAFHGCENLTRVSWAGRTFTQKELEQWFFGTPFYYAGGSGGTTDPEQPDPGEGSISPSDFIIENGVLTRCSAYSAVSITVPEGVTAIGEYAFGQCSKMQQLNLPSTLRAINSWALEGCALRQIDIPDSVTSIGSYAFSDCRYLTRVELPTGLTRLEESTFQNCSSLSQITLPAGLDYIGGYAFRECQQLKNVNLPNSLSEIGAFAFCGTAMSGPLTLPTGLKTLGDNAFADTDLTALTLPEGMDSIGVNLVTGCQALTSITFPKTGKAVEGMRDLLVGEFWGVVDAPNLKELNNIPSTDYAQALQTHLDLIAGLADPSRYLATQSDTITAKAQEITSGLSGDYAKAQAIFQWMTKNITYDYEFFSEQKDSTYLKAEDVLKYRLTVCEGFSALTQALLQSVGIPAVYVSGWVGEAESYWTAFWKDLHAWNMAYVDGRWIIIDSTWGAPGGPGTQGSTLDARYFDPSVYFLASTHSAHSASKPSTGGQPDPDPGKEDPVPSHEFLDVPAGTWYTNAVNWAVSKDITNGTNTAQTEFSPTQDCTHAQILTFLYRAARGAGKAVAADMDKAVAWAREKGMIGTSFDGSEPCTRADAVNYIWQAFGKDSAKASSFTDVPAGASYAKAVDWAVANGITNGTNDAQTQFSPNDICTRGHIVTFLHRAYVPEVRLK